MMFFKKAPLCYYHTCHSFRVKLKKQKNNPNWSHINPLEALEVGGLSLSKLTLLTLLYCRGGHDLRKEKTSFSFV